MIGRKGCCAAVMILLALAACGGGSREPRQEYELRGKVLEVDAKLHKVTVAHEEIPGYMDAMTMPFSVKDDWVFAALAPGRQISATLVVEGNAYWLENITVSEGPSGSTLTIEKATPGVLGTEVPDFVLQDQDGREIRLSQFRGKSLLLTFLYTRCPLPDYCPLMTSHFFSLYRSLEKEASLLARTHMLSVSFDPDFDTPQVLRDYAEGYLKGSASEALKHWYFAVGTKEETKRITGFFGLDYWPEGGQIVHSLRTAVISPDGKLYRLYKGNDWTPSDLLRDVREMP